MATAENLLSTTQILLTPDSLQKFSNALGVPVNKIQEGLRSVLPAFLIGLIRKGSSKDGAERLVNVAQRDGAEPFINQESLNNEAHLQKGDDALQEIFGKNLISISSTISSTTGLNQINTIKMMKMIAPIILGQIKVKLKNERMNSIALMKFLTDQKSIFRNADETYEAPHVSYVERQEAAPHYASKWKLWTGLGIVALICISALWWWTERNDLSLGQPIGTAVAPVEYAAPVATSPLPEAESLEELNFFLSSGNESELPKHFIFSGTESEVTRITNALLSNPSARVRIESSSPEKAQEIRNEVINRGVDSSRIETSASELALELVVTSLR